MLTELRELYVQYQRIPEDHPLEIDPDSIAAIAVSKSLKYALTLCSFLTI